jgi:hypothetical protein
MKDLLNSWNNYITLTEGREVQTVGDLRKIIKLMRAKQAGGEMGKRAASVLVGMLPGGGAAVEIISGAKDGADLIKKFFGANDKFKTNTALDQLNVDDDVSKIVDDPIEVSYLNYLLKDKFKNADDRTPLSDFNATVGLQNYIASKFNNRTVKATKEKTK